MGFQSARIMERLFKKSCTSANMCWFCCGNKSGLREVKEQEAGKHAGCCCACWATSVTQQLHNWCDLESKAWQLVGAAGVCGFHFFLTPDYVFCFLWVFFVWFFVLWGGTAWFALNFCSQAATALVPLVEVSVKQGTDLSWCDDWLLERWLPRMRLHCSPYLCGACFIFLLGLLLIWLFSKTNKHMKNASVCNLLLYLLGILKMLKRCRWQLSF